MSPLSEQTSLLTILEDVAAMLSKTQTNIKKCPKARLTQGYIKARLECIEEYWKTFNEANLGLTKITPREQRGTLPYFLNEEYFTNEDVYLCVKADLLDLMNKLQEVRQPEQPCLDTSDMTLSCVKLPRIQLPCFSGKYDEFPTFEDLFTSLVHNSTSLSQVQKLHYLKSSVSGEAEALLRHIHITESNYQQAWDMLRNRYGNKRLVTTSLLKRLFNQKKILNQSAPHIKSLMDTTTECLNSLENLAVPTGSWDPMIVFLVVQKLDMQTHKEWEEHAYNERSDELPKWKQLQKFLESKFRTLELIAPTSQTTTKERVYTQKSFHVMTNHNEENNSRYGNATKNDQASCTFCNGSHYLYNCKEFTKQPVDDRHSFVQKSNLCFNCLIPNHRVFRCKQRTSCRICRRKHHSLLHKEKNQTSIENNNTPSTTHTNKGPDETDTNITSHCSREQPSDKTVLLATALVDILSSSGESHVFRALIDQGSEASFITAQTAELLGLKKTKINGTVSGVGEGKHAIKHKVNLSMLSESKMPIHVYAYVLKTISSTLPAKKVNINWPELKTLKLADPTCHVPGKIDILLGADIFANIIEEGLVKLQDGIIAQKTSLGWILSGKTNNNQEAKTIITSLFVRENNDLLRQFWEIETELYNKKKILTKEEEECETVYKNTTKRDEEGRYVVHLPLKQNIEETIQKVGDTKHQAIRRFNQLERKFEKNNNLKDEYKKVIHEYIDMSHMKKFKDEQDNETIYLPHHAVVRDDKDTSKVRIVFDASNKGSNGHSLNETMMIGPLLQPDLRSLIMSWRKYKVCIVGDIVKMYRMVKIADEFANLQCIVWRDNPDEEIKSYKLQTVTFGTAAAPYLAVRTLNQLADDECYEHPEYKNATNAIKNCFYMDDLMVGHDDIDEAKHLCHNIKEILKKGGFTMQKWSSNADELLEVLKERDNTKDTVEIKMDKVIKILGLTWNRKIDKFHVTVKLPDIQYPITKRSILSDVARLFDPFGWVSPVVITAKIMIQRLWLSNLSWDDDLPADLSEEWLKYRGDLTDLQIIEIPRWLQTTPRCKEVQIHGFADASSIAYAAVTYLRVVDEHDVVHVTMIASRTKVAPIKQLTIPRLELCAAVMLAQQIDDVSELLEVSKGNIFAYTDSMVVLSWLQSHPNRWKTFVANRVAEILRILDNDRWRHIPSHENPADIASRGIRAADLAVNKIWWNGPEWLKSNDREHVTNTVHTTDLEVKNSFHTNTKEERRPVWERFSNITRMKRVLVFCKRFIKQKAEERKNTNITTNELEDVLQSCIRYYQNEVYGRDIEDLKRNGRVRNKSSLITLSPFLNKNGIMKVGGRLQNADIPETSKHPIIIPKNVHITKLILREAHTRTLHGGNQLMMTYIRSRYWMIGLKAAVRNHIRNCKTCLIDKAKVKTQFMGQLPAVRVRPHRAFLNSGVDYAGPVQIRMSKGRGQKSMKAYICLFVCMATRAIHLEAVTDLTAQGFISAYRRFVSRRGHCAHLWSDNGTNFVGSAKELKALFEEGKANITIEVAELLANDGTTWHFIPPRMPNYGGLWEAGVQSAKRHLNRVNGDTKLTYEEMATLLAQIEACLNSRPLCQLDNTLETMTPLTPGHFLVGEPLITVPDVNHEDKNVNLLTRWQLIQRMTQDFWRRWQNEYLNTLQQRYKWQERVPAPNIGDIVVIKQDLPPTKWLLGIIKNVHPGTDNLVRVVTVQCKGQTEVKRPLSKLILLPKAENC